MIKVYGTDAVEYIQDKLGFVEEFAEGDVEVRIKETKASDLRVASILYRLEGHPWNNITSNEHRAVEKCIDELVDVVSVKFEKDHGKYTSRRRKRRRKLENKEKELAEEVEIEELEEELVD